MFERFTESARRVVVLAQDEARRLDHDYIGTEHLLLGILHEGEGVAARALGSLGISLESARARVIEQIGRGRAAPSSHIPFTPNAKLVIQNALDEARQLHDNYIGSEHILLSMVGLGKGLALDLIGASGLSPKQVRQAVAETLADSGIESHHTDVEVADDASPILGPTCPGCGESLSDTATYTELEVPGADAHDPRITIRVVSCGACGGALGVVP